MAAKELTICLPWPPSVNHYWRHGRGGTYMSTAAKAFRKNVQRDVFAAGCPKVQGRLAVTILAYQPSSTKCDLDNLCKGILDGLTHAGVWHDDEQIDDLRIVRCGVLPPGKIIVRITEIPARGAK